MKSFFLLLLLPTKIISHFFSSFFFEFSPFFMSSASDSILFFSFICKRWKSIYDTEWIRNIRFHLTCKQFSSPISLIFFFLSKRSLSRVLASVFLDKKWIEFRGKIEIYSMMNLKCYLCVFSVVLMNWMNPY